MSARRNPYVPQVITDLRPADRMYLDLPAAWRSYWLRAAAGSLPASDPRWRSYFEEADGLDGMMLERNEEGSQREAEGEVDKAVALYEANVADCYRGSHPYERLRIIYAERKQYEEAIRVCRSFVQQSEWWAQAAGTDHAWKKRQTFREWIEKFQAEAERGGGSGGPR